MRRVLISDPHPAVSRMLVRMVARLGYEPIAIDADPIGAHSRGAHPHGAHPTPAQLRSAHPHGAHPTPAQLRSADALLIEPAAPGALALAHTARAANPQLAIVGEGVVMPRQERAWQATAAPAGYLAKPFTAEQLDAVLQQGFARRDSMGRRNRTSRRTRHARRRQAEAA